MTDVSTCTLPRSAGQVTREDIMRGIEQNEAIIVTPESAREAWQGWRESPDTFMAAAVASAAQ